MMIGNIGMGIAGISGVSIVLASAQNDQWIADVARTILWGTAIVLIVGAILTAVVRLVRKYLSEERRPLAFVIVFAALFLCACIENWDGKTASNAVGLPMLIINALGTAMMAFVGGNSFTVFPPGAGEIGTDNTVDDVLRWMGNNPFPSGVHILFDLLGIIALMLTIEAVLSMFINVTLLLRLRLHRYDDVIVLKNTTDMREQAQSLIDDLCHKEDDNDRDSHTKGVHGKGAKGKGATRHLIFHIEMRPDDDGYSIILGDGLMEVKRTSLEHTLKSAIGKLSHAATGMVSNTTDSRRLPALTSVVMRNGRITVLKHRLTGNGEANNGTSMVAHNLIEDPTRVATDDVYSYSLREIQTRLFVRGIIDGSTRTNGTSASPAETGDADGSASRFRLGAYPLNAMIVGDDVESVTLMTVYLIRNGQSLAGYPTIHIASDNADIIERRLRCAYPALFPDDSGPTRPGTLPLTPPATIRFHRTVFDMAQSPEIDCAGRVTLIVFTSPDTGRAPSQRAIVTRTLQRRFGDLRGRLLFAQYSEDEPAKVIRENGYGGREQSDSKERTIPVRLYGNINEAVSAQVILHSVLDTRAMLVNARYSGIEGVSNPLEADADDITPEIRNCWNGSDLYGRESSRATADFLPVERSINLGFQGNGQAEKNRLESLGRLEHLRWNAYMATSGYVAKPSDTEQFARELEACAQDGSATASRLKHIIRFGGPDTSHIALVDWNWLPQVDAAVHDLTGNSQAAPILKRFGITQWVESMDMQRNDKNIIDLVG